MRCKRGPGPGEACSNKCPHDTKPSGAKARKEKGEAYSALKGFFRKYELYCVVADERDVVRLRTNYRQDENVYLYHLVACSKNDAPALFCLCVAGPVRTAASCSLMLWVYYRATLFLFGALSSSTRTASCISENENDP